MRLVSFRGAGSQLGVGAVVDERVVDLSEIVAAIRFSEDRISELAARGLAVPPGGMLRLLYAGRQAMCGVAQSLEADMIFPVDRLIEYVSKFMTLEPGDVIATGTPAGVGAFRKPPVWLKPGDRVRVEISRVGVLENAIA
jgi:2-keto-4-pentenoate hydratase/2-oxohepta-3-ene-1,7-dioic acid hydratase in catechol pathway